MFDITNAAIIFPLERFFRAVELRGFFFVVVLLRLLVFDCPFAAVFLGVVFLLVFALSSFTGIGKSIKTARLNVKLFAVCLTTKLSNSSIIYST